MTTTNRRSISSAIRMVKHHYDPKRAATTAKAERGERPQYASLISEAIFWATTTPEQYKAVSEAVDEVARKRFDKTTEDLQREDRPDQISMVLSEAEHIAQSLEQGGVEL